MLFVGRVFDEDDGQDQRDGGQHHGRRERRVDAKDPRLDRGHRAGRGADDEHVDGTSSAVPSEPDTWRSVLLTEVPWLRTLLSSAFIAHVVMGMLISDIENMRIA